MSTECTYKIKINSIYKDDQRKNYIEFTCFTLSVRTVLQNAALLSNLCK